jgi:POTRA domain, FtsQ-type
MTSRRTTRRPVSGRGPSRRTVTGGSFRRTRPVRRASAGLTPVRAGAALVMLATAAAIYGVANSSAFEYANLRIEGASLTETTAIESAIDAVRGENLFRLSTAPLEAALAAITTVADATVSVRLPDTLVVQVDEREPVLVWQTGARRHLVDSEGSIFARVEDKSDSGVADLPVVDDRRAASAGLSVGRRIDPVDLDAATRLASLVPGDIGSEAASLGVLVTDPNGFVVRAEPLGWDAVFGFYTPSLRTPEIIPGQVRLLRSLVIGREPTIEKVILASDTDGTYIPKPSPSPDGDDS